MGRRQSINQSIEGYVVVAQAAVHLSRGKWALRSAGLVTMRALAPASSGPREPLTSR
jgi:hypothetical protein